MAYSTPSYYIYIYFFPRLRHIVPPATLLQLYNAIVVPHFDYGDIVYESCTQNNLEIAKDAEPSS